MGFDPLEVQPPEYRPNIEVPLPKSAVTEASCSSSLRFAQGQGSRDDIDDAGRFAGMGG